MQLDAETLPRSRSKPELEFEDTFLGPTIQVMVRGSGRFAYSPAATASQALVCYAHLFFSDIAWLGGGAICRHFAPQGEASFGFWRDQSLAVRRLPARPG